MHVRAELALRNAAHHLAGRHLLTLPHHRGGGLPGVLLELDAHRIRPQIYFLVRRFLFVLVHLQTAAKLRERDTPVFLHGVRLDGLLLNELHARGALRTLAVVAGFLWIQVLGAGVQRA